MKQPELKNNINLLRKISWKYHEKTGMDWDDLFQEAYIGYWWALQQWDPNKGKFSTILWNCMTSQILTYLDSEYKYKYENKLVLDFLPERLTEEHSIFESLDDRSKELIAALVETPFEFIMKDKNEARKRIVESFVGKGWESMEVIMTIRKVRHALKLM